MLDFMGYCLPYLKGCETPKLKPLGKSPKIRSIKFWTEAKTQVPIDTTGDYIQFIEGGILSRKDKTYIENMFSSEPLEKKDLKLEIPFRNNYMSFSEATLFQENVIDELRNIKNYKGKGENKMVGLPYSVNFKKDRNRTTLVWRGAEVSFSDYWHLVSEEYYEATKSEAHNEKFNYLFGFLMAYFKRVHKEMSKTQRKKYLNMVLYPMTQMQQVAFLKGVFYENCRLNYKEATSYLEKIAKGVEFEDGKEKTK